MRRFQMCTVMIAGVVLLSSAADAQAPYVYPQKGQSADQQAKDKSECAQWATGQTGFDPAAAAPPPAAQAETKGGAVRGAAKGAAAGAAVGAIAGDAGKGAAVGAAAGGTGGAVRKRRNEKEVEQQNQQQTAQQDAKRAEYTKALSACLEGRGYSVK